MGGGGVIGELMVRFGADVEPMRRQMAEANRMMDQSGRQMQTRGQRISRVVRDNQETIRRAGRAFVAFGAAGAVALGSIARAGANFQAEMNQVRAVSGATGQEFDALSGQARELGATTRFSASEAAEGMGFLSMAGFEATETLEAMPGVLQLAAAGNMDLATTADIASNVLQGFALDASEVGRVNDVMAATFSSANTDMQQLGQAMSFVAPVAQGLGIEVESVSAAIGFMSDAGIQGSRAGTSLRMALGQLADTSGPAADVLERLGVNAHDAEDNLLPLDEIIRQLEHSGASTSDMLEMFGQRAGPGMAVLVERGGDALAEFTEQLEDSGGTAGRIADIQMEGLKGSVIELGSAWEGLKVSLFEAGLGDWAEGAVDNIAGVVRRLEGLPEPAQRAAMAVTGVGTAAGLTGGAALLMLPRIVAISDSLQRFGGLAAASRAGLAGMARFMTGPWGIAIAAAVMSLQAFRANTIYTLSLHDALPIYRKSVV